MTQSQVRAQQEGKNEAALLRLSIADQRLYEALANREEVPEFKDTLLRLAALSKNQAMFWAKKVGKDIGAVTPQQRSVGLYRFMRKALGLTLTVRYIFGREEERIKMYRAYCITCTVSEDQQTIETFAREMDDVIDTIKEERVAFFSNIILGFNDALIELTGVLVGFSFALKEPRYIIIGGLITGFSASMSMAASAFLQARHEEDGQPLKAALFTGISYFTISIVLVTPFLLASSISLALLFLFVIIFVLVAGVSFYSAVVMKRKYLAQFGEILALSLGVAVVAFVIGRILDIFIP